MKTEDCQSEFLPSQTDQSSAEEQTRREAAQSRLTKLLKDLQFRAIEGFPIGTDEDILALSDPPYYTACPNPFLQEIIARWQQERKELRRELNLTEENYQREPFAADVSEGKNDPIYNAHSYHTKVPHKAIMRYILHYTDPGDIVFDGFCGTGMTGVAAQLCGDKKAVEELGYRVDDKGVIWDSNKAISSLDARKTVLNDLSPAATFIAYNYNTPVDTAAFEREANRILKEVEREYGWMYETWHPSFENSQKTKGRIIYTIWSDIFVCPHCGGSIVFWEHAIDEGQGKIVDEFSCPKCNLLLSKRNLGRAKELIFDHRFQRSVEVAKQVPVLIIYDVGQNRYKKKPDSFDLKVLERIKSESRPYFYPVTRIDRDIDLWYERDYRSLGVYSVDGFFTVRNLLVASALWNLIIRSHVSLLRFAFTGINRDISKLTGVDIRKFFKGGGGPFAGGVKGTLYIPSVGVEKNVFFAFENRIERIKAANFHSFQKPNKFAISNQSSDQLIQIPTNSIDYVFTDPPFGDNIIYSDLSIIWESWLRLFTNVEKEAVIHRRKQGNPSTIDNYFDLIVNSFFEVYRILKPGHWLTVEFHNTRNSVWNAIQEAILHAGFMIADVRTLDKQQGSFKQVTTASAVKQDLVISAYKPNGNLEGNFRLKAGTDGGVWEFIRYHLSKLPVINLHESELLVNPERQAFLLFDRMVAFHIQRGVMVPFSAPEFYAGLQQRFISRDGMYFLPEQVAEYDRAVIDSKGVVQLSFVITDEKTAIQWLRQQLDPNSGGQPQTHADLNPKFKMVLHQAKHENAPELIEILEQNFLQDEEGKWYIPDHNKASDLEKVRQRSLLREYKEYVSGQGRLRQFRTEAVRVGFASAYKQKDYSSIIKVANRLPEDVLREDPDLLMYYDSTMLRKSK